MAGFVDRGGTIAVGGQSQRVAPYFRERVAMDFQNTSGGDLWLREVTNKGQLAAGPQSPSFRLEPGDSATIETNDEVAVWGALAGQSFSCTERW